MSCDNFFNLVDKLNRNQKDKNKIKELFKSSIKIILEKRINYIDDTDKNIVFENKKSDKIDENYEKFKGDTENYRKKITKLSSLVHPDKCDVNDKELCTEIFQEIKYCSRKYFDINYIVKKEESEKYYEIKESQENQSSLLKKVVQVVKELTNNNDVSESLETNIKTINEAEEEEELSSKSIEELKSYKKTLNDYISFYKNRNINSIFTQDLPKDDKYKIDKEKPFTHNDLKPYIANIEKIIKIIDKIIQEKDVKKAMDDTKYREEKSEKEINNKDAEYTEKQQEDKEKRNEKEEQEREERERNMKNKVSVLIILTCDSNNNPNYIQYSKEIDYLKSKFETEKIHEINWNNNEKKEIIKNFKNITNKYKSLNCDITFCGSYGNVCVIKTLVITASVLNNKNNNYFFSFMGTRFSKGRLFETETPSICNVYSSFKKGFLFNKGINTGNDKNYSANKFNLLNHKYWINESIDKKIKQPIKIRFLDYEGKLYKPKGEKPNYDFFIEITKTIGGKNQKTRKIKAKNTQKIRVKNPRKRSQKTTIKI